MAMSPPLLPVHGGLDPVELESLGVGLDSVVDFSASINPLGPPPGVREAVAEVDFAVYPDRHCHALRQALSQRLEVDADHILIGNGSAELVHLLARAYLARDRSAFIFAPTFSEYEAACRTACAQIWNEAADEASGFQWNMDRVLSAVGDRHPCLVFLCNPNNPTGVYLSHATVEKIARSIQGGGLLVLDEAYVSFTEEAWDSRRLLHLGNVVVLRSLTKDYALAGLRLGYMLATPRVVEEVRQFQPSWSVNAIAQAAGLAALDSGEYLDQARVVIGQSKAYLERELCSLGLEVAPKAANFLLVKVGDAAALRLRLLKGGLCVRDCTSFGLPQHIRIGVRRLEECRQLIAALQEVLAGG